MFYGMALVWVGEDSLPYPFALVRDGDRLRWLSYEVPNERFADAELSADTVQDACQKLAASYPDAQRILWLMEGFFADTTR